MGLFKAQVNEGQDMEIEHFQTILKMGKGCHVRSSVANGLIYLDAKWDGTVITPMHLCADTATILQTPVIDSLNKRLAPRPLPLAYTPLQGMVQLIVWHLQAGHGWRPLR